MSTIALPTIIDDVMTFWFGNPDADYYGRDRPEWFVKDAVFDAEIRAKFLHVIEAARAVQLDMMADSPEGAVALVVVLDQFPRNVYRDDARAFENDAHALRLARDALERGFDADLMPVMRKFLYLPFEHSENLADQDRALELFATLDDQSLEWAQKHRAIIDRFGRFPHRNAALGRISTPEENEFLTQPDSSF